LSAAVAVINSGEGRTAVWHVYVGPPMQQMSRLCGSWVTADDAVVPDVLAGRPVFPVRDRFPGHAEALRPATAGLIDLAGTYANIEAWIAEQNRLHAESRTDKGNKRAPISWPALLAPLDWDALPPPLPGVVDDPLIADTIVAANWLAGLAEAWAAIETTRLSREHLRTAGDRNPRPLPLALRN